MGLSDASSNTYRKDVGKDCEKNAFGVTLCHAYMSVTACNMSVTQARGKRDVRETNSMMQVRRERDVSLKYMVYISAYVLYIHVVCLL